MPRKVFISILGAGFYDPCTYTDTQKGFRLSTRFIQQASLELAKAKEWGKEDKVIIFLTEKARKDNWSKDIDKRFSKGKTEAIPYEGLEAVLQKMNLQAQIEGRNIKDGMNEEEIWDVFQTIFDSLEEEDELYLDITHGFRLLPMLLLVLVNYAKFLKGITIKNIVYGNFEARVNNEAPIISLLPIVSLQDWTSAAANYLQNGRVTQLKELVGKELKPVLQNTEDPNMDARALGKYVNALERLTQSILNCRGKDIREAGSIRAIHNEANRIDSVIIPPMVPVFNKIHQPLTVFSPTESIENGFFAAQWCLGKQLYQQAITLLQETIVSLLCKENALDLADKNQRKLVNSAFAIAVDNIPEENWLVSENDAGRSANEKAIIKRLLQSPKITALAKVFKEITGIRNDFNHAGEDRGGARRVEKIIEGIVNCRDASFAELDISDTTETPRDAVNPDKPLRPLFINLSNHPSSTWQPTQLAAAGAYGDIIDMPFPTVDTHCDAAMIDHLASKYVLDIINRGAPEDITVHVMGEMTLTFRIVELLKAQGIRCVASTTERIVTNLSDNKKETQFAFVQFREY